MHRFHRLLLAGIASVTCMTAQSAVVLNGTVRDFCAPSTASCTHLSDFEGPVPGVVTGMLNSTAASRQAWMPAFAGMTEFFWSVPSTAMKLTAPAPPAASGRTPSAPP